MNAVGDQKMPDENSTEAPKGIETQAPSAKGDDGDHGWKQAGTPLNSLIDLARSFKAVPGNLQFFALIVVLLVIAGLVFGFRGAIARSDAIGFIAAVGVFVVVVVAMVLGVVVIAAERKQRIQSELRLDEAARRLETQPTLQELERGLAQRFAGDGGATIAWVRLVPRLPLSNALLDNLQQELVRLRSAAATALVDLGAQPQIQANLVRANIFLPDSRRAQVGQVCGLFIPKSLHVNMQDPRERDLIFRPDEGLTGRVFVQEEAEGAVYDAKGQEWHRVTFFGPPPDPQDGPDYTLTEYQQQLISDRLRWVVSFPVKVPDVDQEATVAVVNIDGLDMELTPEKMKELFLRLATSEIPKFSTILADADFDRVAILLAKGG